MALQIPVRRWRQLGAVGMQLAQAAQDFWVCGVVYTVGTQQLHRSTWCSF